MTNNLKWFVLTIDGENNELSLSFVRQNSTKVYFLRNRHRYSHVHKAVNAGLNKGYFLQKISRNRKYYSPNPIPETD